MDFILHSQAAFIVALLIMLEVALSVDNLAGMRKKLACIPKNKRAATSMAASVSGLAVRIALVLLLVNLGKLMDPLFVETLFKSGKGVLLTLGGAFLIVKAMCDLKHHRNKEENPGLTCLDNQTPSLGEIIIYDALLSIDSVVAALALANNLDLVLIAMVLAHVFLNVFWKQIDNFFLERPSMMTITLSFVLVVGLVSMVRVLGVVLAEETLVVAIVFAIMVELMNDRRSKPLTNSGDKARARIRSYSGYQEESVPLTGSFINLGQTESKLTAPMTSSSEARVTENLFTSQICDQCNSTTYSAFHFCMSCGYSEQPA